ncbi:uncharacterized protein BDR25DRAFT_319053 [Lindgomyces ingoldianus]|uniref:Uncharacterized protein n=1 Tax=Lindgomyces ingoldianus TaxID=673940 RepID=A0ACB6QF85_9PLEO|nr:uncharacterized protein BDR25DRAFT_319053 [Lindgomyces ingoldianus]KAF2464796.1 hypothetical protein BDR25DRAFT_319053 [Lindgomyces ingoldianus]
MAKKDRKKLADLLLWGLIQLVTLPYHRFFTYNTLKPALEIQEYATRGVERNSLDRKKLHSLLCGWRTRKRDELAFVSGVTITAIVTASFSWPVIQDSYWLASGVWYASLMTSVCGILISAQQVSLLTLVGDLPVDPLAASSKTIQRHLNQILIDCQPPIRDSDEAAHEYSQQWVLSWKQIFTWQCPMMFFGYSTLLYFVGLTVIVCTPLIEERKGPTINVAITYLVASGISWGLFAYCSLGGYRAITLDGDPDDTEIA